MDITKLIDQQREKCAAADEIRTRVYEQQDGEWRGDDRAQFDLLLAEAETHKDDYERMAKLDALATEQEKNEEVRERRTAPRISTAARPATTPERRREDRALALQGWVAGCSIETEGIVTQRHHEAAQRCGVNLNQRSINVRLPGEAPHSVRDLQRGSDWEQRVITVALESPDSDGGILTVPDEMMRPLEKSLLAFGGMRQVSTIIRTSTGADLPIPMLNDTSNSGALLAEATEHTEQDLAFTQLVLNAFKYTSKRVGMSVEYLQDNAVNAAGRIGEILGERIGRITNTHFTTGDGSAKPNGIMTAANSAVTAASATTVTHDELITLKHAVDPAYRDMGARWMFNDATLAMLKKVKIPQYSGDTVGQPLWRPGLALSEPNTIDGDPYTINQQMPAPTTGLESIVYGALSKYIIRDVRDITLVRLDERYAELGVVAFLAFSRHDGDLLDAGTDPIKSLTMG